MRLIDEGIEMPAEPSKNFGDTFSDQLKAQVAELEKKND